MFSKDENKAARAAFWDGFKRYCSRHKIYRKWVLTGVKIKSSQLKFYADDKKALVLFQIDHKNPLRRYEVYEAFYPYKKLWEETCGDELKWDEDFQGIEERNVSAIYFELPGVSIKNPDDHPKIYAFFVGKMPLLEELYWEYKDLINSRIP